MATLASTFSSLSKVLVAVTLANKLLDLVSELDALLYDMTPIGLVEFTLLASICIW